MELFSRTLTRKVDDMVVTVTSVLDKETKLNGSASCDPIQWLHLTTPKSLRENVQWVLDHSPDMVMEKSGQKLDQPKYVYEDLHCPKCHHVQLINDKTCNVRDEKKPINLFIAHLTLCIGLGQKCVEFQNKNGLIKNEVLVLLRKAQDKQKRVQVTPIFPSMKDGYVLKLPITSPISHIICRGATIWMKSLDPDFVHTDCQVPFIIQEDDDPSSSAEEPQTLELYIDFEDVYKENLAYKAVMEKKELARLEYAEKEKVLIVSGLERRRTGVIASCCNDAAKKKNLRHGGIWHKSVPPSLKLERKEDNETPNALPKDAHRKNDMIAGIYALPFREEHDVITLDSSEDGENDEPLANSQNFSHESDMYDLSSTSHRHLADAVIIRLE